MFFRGHTIYFPRVSLSLLSVRRLHIYPYSEKEIHGRRDMLLHTILHIRCAWAPQFIRLNTESAPPTSSIMGPSSLRHKEAILRILRPSLQSPLQDPGIKIYDDQGVRRDPLSSFCFVCSSPGAVLFPCSCASPLFLRSIISPLFPIQSTRAPSTLFL
jgi:hypothetical protein